MKRIGTLIAVLLAIMFGCIYTSPVVNTLAWTVIHHATVKLDKVEFKVPSMWRQEETPAGQHNAYLSRYHWGRPYSDENIVVEYNYAHPVSPQAKVNRFILFASRLGQTSYKTEYFASDSFIQAHYICLIPRLTKLPRFLVSCDSVDGRFTIDLMGKDEDIQDFISVLHNVAEARETTLSGR